MDIVQRAAAACARGVYFARAELFLEVAADRLVASLCALLPAARVALRLRVASNASVLAAQLMRVRLALKWPGRESKQNPFF
jgi:hypothetical protein